MKYNDDSKRVGDAMTPSLLRWDRRQGWSQRPTKKFDVSHAWTPSGRTFAVFRYGGARKPYNVELDQSGGGIRLKLGEAATFEEATLIAERYYRSNRATLDKEPTYTCWSCDRDDLAWTDVCGECKVCKACCRC